jgi:hypothetical protein
MPNPEYEGVARQIEVSLEKAGGDELKTSIYDIRVKGGSTILTHIHHRQTPLFLMQGVADPGVTLKPEAIFQEQVGHPNYGCSNSRTHNTIATYAGALVRNAAHPAAAKAWLDFIHSAAALSIFEQYGSSRIQANNAELCDQTPHRPRAFKESHNDQDHFIRDRAGPWCRLYDQDRSSSDEDLVGSAIDSLRPGLYLLGWR